MMWQNNNRLYTHKYTHFSSFSWIKTGKRLACLKFSSSEQTYRTIETSYFIIAVFLTG